jgi:hypothetical protein
MSKDFILSLVRHLLTGVGSVFMARGYADSATVEAVIGGVLALVGLGLSYKDKAQRLS